MAEQNPQPKTLTRVYPEDSFLREITIPEEQRHQFTTKPWSGGYRWFQSPNVVPIEHYTRVSTTTKATAAAPPSSPTPPRPPKAA